MLSDKWSKQKKVGWTFFISREVIDWLGVKQHCQSEFLQNMRPSKETELKGKQASETQRAQTRQAKQSQHQGFRWYHQKKGSKKKAGPETKRMIMKQQRETLGRTWTKSGWCFSFLSCFGESSLVQPPPPPLCLLQDKGYGLSWIPFCFLRPWR